MLHYHQYPSKYLDSKNEGKAKNMLEIRGSSTSPSSIRHTTNRQHEDMNLLPKSREIHQRNYCNFSAELLHQSKSFESQSDDEFNSKWEIMRYPSSCDTKIADKKKKKKRTSKSICFVRRYGLGHKLEDSDIYRICTSKSDQIVENKPPKNKNITNYGRTCPHHELGGQDNLALSESSTQNRSLLKRQCNCQKANNENSKLGTMETEAIVSDIVCPTCEDCKKKKKIPKLQNMSDEHSNQIQLPVKKVKEAHSQSYIAAAQLRKNIPELGDLQHVSDEHSNKNKIPSPVIKVKKNPSQKKKKAKTYIIQGHPREINGRTKCLSPTYDPTTKAWYCRQNIQDLRKSQGKNDFNRNCCLFWLRLLDDEGALFSDNCYEKFAKPGRDKIDAIPQQKQNLFKTKKENSQSVDFKALAQEFKNVCKEQRNEYATLKKELMGELSKISQYVEAQTGNFCKCVTFHDGDQENYMNKSEETSKLKPIKRKSSLKKKSLERV